MAALTHSLDIATCYVNYFKRQNSARKITLGGEYEGCPSDTPRFRVDGLTCFGSTGVKVSHWKPVRARVAAMAMTSTSVRDCELPASTTGATPEIARFSSRAKKPEAPENRGTRRNCS